MHELFQRAQLWAAYDESLSHSQSKDLWGVSGLDVVTLALSSVSSDDCKVLAGDGEDGPAVLGVGIEATFLRRHG